MSTYKIQLGDTLELIAAKKYGSTGEAYRIQNANPGLKTPLTPGNNIIIPPAPIVLEDKLHQASGNINEVIILIDGQRFRFWSEISIRKSIDTIDTIVFTSVFDPDNNLLRSVFENLSFKTVVVTVGGDPFFKGILIGPETEQDTESSKVALNCYSLPGVLNDCTPPASAITELEFTKVNLQIIASKLASFFGIQTLFEEDPGPIFDRVAIKSDENILSFLIKLAKQRELVINSTELGVLRFTKSISAGKPVAYLSDGESPLLKLKPEINPQEYYSHITGVSPATSGFPSSQYTIKNPKLTGYLRPHTFIAQNSNQADLEKAVRAKFGRMFGNVVKYSIELATWRDPDNNIWEPNTLISVHAPNVMIYNPYIFLIRTVNLKKDANSESASLELVLKESFSGTVPGALPWD